MTIFVSGHLPLCASIDTDVAQWFRQHLTPAFADFLLGLSQPGSAICIASIIGVVVFYLAWKREWLGVITLLTTVGGGALMGEGMKLVFQRPRPFLAGPIGEWGGYSFPSGHTIGATLLYGLVAVVLIRILPRRRWKWLVTCAATFLIAGVGFSRIALGAHYVSDVLAAMLLGSLWILMWPRALKTAHRKWKAQAVTLSDPISPESQNLPS